MSDRDLQSLTAAEVLPSTGSGGSEPEAVKGVGLPTPLWMLLVIMLYWGVAYVYTNGGGFHPLVYNPGEQLADLEARVPRSEADLLLGEGRRVYATFCVACHQADGRGLPGQFPPLAGSDWVLNVGPNRMIRIVLNGLQGPITVNGQSYNNVMLPWRDQLADADIAAVLTFVRGNAAWGNQGSPVTPEQVKAIRDATADREGYWTAPELLQIPASD